MDNIRPKNPLTWIKYRYLEWRWDRVLKKSSWTNWQEYSSWNDPDFLPWGSTVKEQLCGYPHIALVDYTKLPTRFNPWFVPVEHCELMLEWCNKNCKNKYRSHWVSVPTIHEGYFQRLSQVAFGFKDELDYIMFTLRWV